MYEKYVTGSKDLKKEKRDKIKEKKLKNCSIFKIVSITVLKRRINLSYQLSDNQ